MAESFSVEAILSATDKNMSSTMKKAIGACQSFGDRVKSIVAGVGITKVIGASMNVLSSSLDGAKNNDYNRTSVIPNGYIVSANSSATSQSRLNWTDDRTISNVQPYIVVFFWRRTA